MLLIRTIDDYHLGIEISTGKLFRIPKEFIPKGFVKVNRLSVFYGSRLVFSSWDYRCSNKYNVYDENGRLIPKFWSLQRQLK